MIKYVTYHKIIDLLESVQQASPRMKSFAQGDIVYFADSMSGNTIQYPLMFATPLAMSYDENTTTYQVVLLSTKKAIIQVIRPFSYDVSRRSSQA